MIAPALLVLASALARGGATPPTRAPDFAIAESDAAVVVATSRPGESLPAPECEKQDVICLRWPFWFRLEVVQTVHGTVPARTLFVTTWSHYDQPEPDDVESPRLILLRSHGDDTVMPAYANARVFRRDDGEYFMPVSSQHPLSWLPCEAFHLREPIDALRFPPQMLRDADDWYVREHPDLFVRLGDQVAPRNGIAVRRLGEWLANRRPGTREFDCEPEPRDPANG